MRYSAPHPRFQRDRLVLLAPSAAAVPAVFRSVDVDPARHAAILGDIQRLRGRTYLEDGAILSSQLTADGRHALPVDAPSWHIASCEPGGEVIGCARYRAHEPAVRPEELGVWRSAAINQPHRIRELHAAIEEDIARARRRQIAFVEVGGWAIAAHRRFSAEAMQIALSTFALARGVGGCIGMTTATVRNCSSKILRKIGGHLLEPGGVTLRPYYDPQYGCEMELLRFDSTTPNPRYEPWIDQMVRSLLDVTVICANVGFATLDLPRVEIRPRAGSAMLERAVA